jgi:single-strand DNA-binding protein
MAQTFELEGTLKQLFDTQTFASGFAKREFVVEVPDGKFPQMIKFECVKDKIAMLDGVSIGDQVKVAFDIRGSEYKERFYVNLNAWKLTKSGGGGGGDEDSGPRGNFSKSGGSRREEDSGPRTNSSLDASFDNEPDNSDDIPF